LHTKVEILEGVNEQHQIRPVYTEIFGEIIAALGVMDGSNIACLEVRYIREVENLCTSK
jgi:hypothetical protein